MLNLLMLKQAWAFLKRWLPHIAALALVCAAVGFAYFKGFQTASERAAAEIAAVKAEAARKAAEREAAYEKAYAESEKAYAAELAKAQQALSAQAAKTQAVGIALAQKQAETGRLKRQLKTGIENAIAKDKARAEADGRRCIDGMGADSLRLYRRALGYNPG